MLYDDSQVAIIEITVAPEDLVWMYENVQSDSLHEASIHFTNAHIDETIDQVGFRIRGNTSRVSQKKSFKLSFNTFVPGRQFYDVDKLNLNGEHNDPTIMRSKLSWDLYGKTGLIATRAAHCAVFINDVYFGLYISVEHIDDEFLENHFADDSGNLWKCLWPADLTYRGSNPEAYHPYHDETHPYELKTNRDDYDFSKLAHLIDIINNSNSADFPDSLEQVLIVPEVLKYAAMNVITGNWDDYWFLKNNFYLYHEPGIDRFHWIPYDNDNSFGIDWFGVDWTEVNPYTFENIEETQGNEPGPRPLMENIMANAQYRNLYSHFLEFFQANITRLDHWEAHVDHLKELITPWADLDTFRSLDYGFNIQDFHQSFQSDPYSNQHVKNGLKEFVNLRHNSLPNQIVWEATPPNIYDISHSPQYPGPEDSIYVTVAAHSPSGFEDITIQYHPGPLLVIIYIPMTFEPIIGSTIVEEADRWVGVIPPLGNIGFGRFRIEAVDLNGQAERKPPNDFINLQILVSGTSPLVINEFLAKNDGVNTDASGEYDDWLEIYNGSDENINLGGLFLTDDPENLSKWQFPIEGESIELLGQDHLLIWCDEDEEQVGFHTNFKLSANGEFLALVAEDGSTIIDAINFDAQEADVSYGRDPDGSEFWTYFSEPSPGFANATTAIYDLPILPVGSNLENYPNPFNAETRILFKISEPGDISLTILNLQGREIIQLSHGPRNSGNYMQTWNARDTQGRVVPAGIYFYRLQTPRTTITKKMLILN